MLTWRILNFSAPIVRFSVSPGEDTVASISSRHIGVHPSPVAAFSSSHCSPVIDSSTPLPHLGGLAITISVYGPPVDGPPKPSYDCTLM
jgi:hypothetical protein